MIFFLFTQSVDFPPHETNHFVADIWHLHRIRDIKLYEFTIEIFMTSSILNINYNLSISILDFRIIISNEFSKDYSMAHVRFYFRH